MTIRRALTRQCSCANPTDAFADAGMDGCEFCEESPCVYVALFETCRFYTRVTETYPNAEHIKDSGYMYLLKDCSVGCTWTAKWVLDSSCTPPAAYASPGCWAPIDINATGVDCCWWGGDPGTALACDSTTLDEQEALGRLWDVWTLEITDSDSATLTVTPKTGGSAQYTCDNFVCGERNQFRFDAAGATDNLKHLPCGVCVGPENTGYTDCANDCDTVENRRLCCDYVNPCDKLTINLTNEGCEGPITQTFELNRTVEASLPCGPAARYPSTAPCGVFWGTFSMGDPDCPGTEGEAWSGTGGMMMWCDPSTPLSPYKGEAYCYDDFENCFIYQGPMVFTAFECCPVLRFSFDLPPMDCCCGAVACCTCDDLPSSGTVSDGLGGSLPLSKTCVSGETTMAYTVVSALDTLCGELITSGTVSCCGGVMVATLNGTEIPLDWDGDRSAILGTGMFRGCEIFVAI